MNYLNLNIFNIMNYHENIHIFFFLIVIFGVFLNYILLKRLKTLRLNNLLDCDFNKPQSFHNESIPRIGGLVFYVLFIVVIFFFTERVYYDLIFLSLVCFFIGFADDIKLIKSPLLRLLLLFVFINFTIYYFGIETPKFQILGLDEILLKNNLFRIFLLSICFLFIINGANFIDGYNGLLLIQFIIILIILIFINYNYFNFELLFLCFLFLTISIPILLFNFPKAKLFLGDSGSYLIGGVISYLLIKTSTSTKLAIPSFVYACIIYYIFFEVVFSFFRKLILEKKNPFHPDSKHLHMLLFKFLNKKYNRNVANYKTTLYLNLIYILSIIPLIFFFENLLLLKIYFFSLLVFYIFIYYLLNYLNSNSH